MKSSINVEVVFRGRICKEDILYKNKDPRESVMLPKRTDEVTCTVFFYFLCCPPTLLNIDIAEAIILDGSGALDGSKTVLVSFASFPKAST